MDILTDIFGTLDLKGVLYFRTNFSPPWAVEVPSLEDTARFHLVIQGTCHVILPKGESLVLNTGDLILLPRGQSHILADRLTNEAQSLETVLDDLNYDGNGVLIVGQGDECAATKMVCGHFTYRKGAAHPLLNSLPDYIHTTAGDRVTEPLLDELLRLISHRIFIENIGSKAAVTRMSEIVFIELVRAGISRDESLSTMINAFRDKCIGHALELIHKRTSEPWEVESLAREVGMSRSRFSNRFSDLMNVSPMAYLAEWRLQKALTLLGDARISVQQVSNRVGYQSPAAFTRAFSKRFGESPSQYQKSA
ncbi:AraC family transcriptional regulator [Alteromonadaceae bacterium M269]|nr:AraC family transcriptional regulator [Alteromonadaceae bacterium M269]